MEKIFILLIAVCAFAWYSEAKSVACPPLCRMGCKYGYEKDENGCPICKCKPKPECRKVLCRMNCPNGWAKDENGCDLCKCKDVSALDDAPLDDVPPPRPPMCKMLCPNGFETVDGKPICKCKPFAGCLYNGRVYKFGQQFGCLNGKTPSCECLPNGRVMCALPDCLPPPKGAIPVRSNQCCPQYEVTVHKGCDYRGKTYKIGEGFGCMNGNTPSCKCLESGRVVCALPGCVRPPFGCKPVKSNQCCPQCERKECTWQGKTYKDGETWGCKFGTRRSCVCLFGEARCIVARCRPLPKGCKPIDADQCCPKKCQKCPPLCKMHCPNGFERDENGCEICKCKQKDPPAKVCKMFCPNGFETVDGKEICRCKKEHKCDGVCTREYNPQCGTNGRTYGNPCMLEHAQCRDNTIKKAHEGKCNKLKCDDDIDEDYLGSGNQRRRTCPRAEGSICKVPKTDGSGDVSFKCSAGNWVIVKACEPVKCKIFCPNGYEKDENGCDICKCKRASDEIAPMNDARVPPPKTCRMRCPNGFETVDGKPICKCKKACEPVKCKIFCPNGYEKDENGCDICKCKKACEPVKCKIFCPNGYEKDENGCDICKCKRASDEIAPMNDARVPPPKTCRMWCPNGFEIVDGKPICKCKKACEPVKCKIFCPNGYEKDENGCDICKCKKGCKPVLCRMRCPNGWAKDRDGCDMCKCA